MKNISDKELKTLILNKTTELYDKNETQHGSNVVLPRLVMQMSVYATLQVLEELGLLTLPKK